jgi:uroporphyrinogen III methyltransferase/synthase
LNKPLAGKTILVTRAENQASELVRLIQEKGGEAVTFPTIQIHPPSRVERLQALEDAVNRLSAYDWIIFTSVNGVTHFLQAVQQKKLDPVQVIKAKIAAVGPKTAAVLQAKGFAVELIPKAFHAGALAETLKSRLKPGLRVLLPRGDLARPELPERLKEMGLRVTELIVYETVPGGGDSRKLAHLLKHKQIDVITFTSPSTLKNLLAILEQCEFPASRLHEFAELACIGPVTAKEAAEHGLHVTYMAEESTVSGLVEALCRGLNARQLQKEDL